MAQPPTYVRQYSFSDFQESNPADPLPATQHEIELNAIKTTLDAILTNLALIQRDDGEIANLSIGNDQLKASLRVGINPPTVWSALTAYSVDDTVVYANGGRSELWLCLEAHTSTSDFDTDSLTSGYWRKLADFATITLSASQTSYDNSTSGLTADTVQDAIDELEDEIDAVNSGVSDGDKGDITVSSSGTVWEIDNGVVDANALATDAVETAKIKDGNVTSAKIASSAIVSGKIASSAITTAKINDDAVTYAKMQDTAATQRVLGRNSAGGGTVEEVTLSELLDWIGSAAQGDILYRGSSAWARLAAGTSGQFLQTQGTGANPQWADSGGAWALVSEFYDHGTDGTVASVETPTLADGYEYRVDFEGISSSADNVALECELYQETTDAYATQTVLSQAEGELGPLDSATALNGVLFLPSVRSALDMHPVHGGVAIAAAQGEGATWSGGVAMAAAEKVSKARFSLSSGNIDAGKMRLYRRAV